MNKYFNYPNKELWSRDSWTNTYSVISPLTKWISIKNHENFSFQLDPNVPKREGGVFSDKVYGYEYPEVTRYWADKGLVYHADSMTHGWVSMIPSSFFENTGSEPRVLLVLVSADLKSNDQWIINLLDRYESYNQAAADEGFMILYIASNGPDMVGQYVNIVQEFAAINHIKYKDLWLDVSTVYKLGLKLSDAPDFTMEDPDSLVKPFSKLEIPALNISNGLWANQNSLTVDLLTTVKGSNAAFDGQKVINSIAGEKLSTGIYIEYAFKDAHAPEFVEYIEGMGLKYGIHSHKNEQWLSFVSKGALEDPENKLPVFVMLKEVNTIDPHQAITASGYCYDFIKLAAQGDFILVFFALESKEDNDMIHDILQELAEEYPADLNRVYIAGHSHNASFAMHYAIRNPGDIAAYATLGIAPGIALEQYSKGFFKFSDEDLDALASYDIPCINAHVT